MAASVSRREVVELLESSLGTETATQLVQRSSRELRISGDPLTRDEAIKILRNVGDEPGLVGITARLAVSRLLFGNSIKAAS